jgi:nicotinamidase-related amidase
MAKSNDLRFGALGADYAHLCVDMQRMFCEPTDWHTPWMAKILPAIEALVATHPKRTVFMRFVLEDRSDTARGSWQRYYRRWSRMTRSQLDPSLIEIVPTLARFVPPALVVDKKVYSPWFGSQLYKILINRGVDTIIVSGGETDICVLATVLGAIDGGFRVIVVSDALCSSVDKLHDAIMTLYADRFNEQVELATTDILLKALPRR